MGLSHLHPGSLCAPGRVPPPEGGRAKASAPGTVGCRLLPRLTPGPKSRERPGSLSSPEMWGGAQDPSQGPFLGEKKSFGDQGGPGSQGKPP